MIGVKSCGEFHTQAKRTEHGGGRWKKHDGTGPSRESVLAERRRHRRKARLDLAATARALAAPEQATPEPKG